MSRLLAGISYPFRTEGGGLPKEAKGTEAIRSCLIALLKKNKRTSVMQPTLGVGLQQLIFENMGPALRARIIRDIATNVAEFIPQVNLIDIRVTESDHTVTVEVFYSANGVPDSTGPLEFQR